MRRQHQNRWQVLAVLGLAALLGLGATRSEGGVLRILLTVTIGAAVFGGLRIVHPLFLGLATVALLPVVSLADMLSGGGSHNLWPIEWLFYALLAVPATGGAWAGDMIISIFAGRMAPHRTPEPSASSGADQKLGESDAPGPAREAKLD